MLTFNGNRRLAVVMVFFAGWLLCSCSVKEDRTPCPGYLFVSFVDGDKYPGRIGMIGYADGEQIFHDSVFAAECDPYWIKAVRKNIIRLGSYTGIDQSYCREHSIVIEQGNQADSTYSFFQEVDCLGDEAYVDVTFHKQFCTVHLDIDQSAEDMQRFIFEVTGNSCGFDVLSFKPVAGPFHFEPKAVEGERVVDFRIPRQKDMELKLKLWYVNPRTGIKEDMGVYPLASYIAKTGYDWETEDLQDVYIRIGLTIGSVTVSIQGWEDGIVIPLIEM